MAIVGYTITPVPEAEVEAAGTKALADKVQQIERRISHFIDDSADYGDVDADTTIKEMER